MREPSLRNCWSWIDTGAPYSARSAIKSHSKTISSPANAATSMVCDRPTLRDTSLGVFSSTTMLSDRSPVVWLNLPVRASAEGDTCQASGAPFVSASNPGFLTRFSGGNAAASYVGAFTPRSLVSK